MVAHLGRRAVDGVPVLVARDRGELAGEANRHLRRRSRKLRRRDLGVVDRDDGGGHGLIGGGARADRGVEIGVGLGRHQAAQRLPVARGERVNHHVVGGARPGQERLPGEARVGGGDGVESRTRPPAPQSPSTAPSPAPRPSDRPPSLRRARPGRRRGRKPDAAARAGRRSAAPRRSASRGRSEASMRRTGPPGRK